MGGLYLASGFCFGAAFIGAALSQQPWILLVIPAVVALTASSICEYERSKP